ncbi:MAG: alpha/beta hydrolase [Planctomycetota bacterium]
MIFPLFAALAFSLPTLAIVLVVGLVRWLLKKPQRRYWAICGWVHLGLFAIHLFVTFPAALGLLGSRGLGTRGDERSYEGPRIAADGALLVQSKQTLRRERDGQDSIDEAVLAAARDRAHDVAGADGVTLRIYRVPARAEAIEADGPRAVAVLVHGLFRSSLELETVAGMLRERGCECWLMDQRNHGHSTRSPFTGGLRESQDVVAVVDYVRAQPGRADRPLLLYGVSLGTIAVSLALPHIEGVGGVVLDAPIDDLTAAAHRMMTFERQGDRRSWFYLYEPWRSLTLTALGAWSGFATTDVSPIEVLATVRHDLPMLVISEGLDDRAPPDTVRALFERLPQHDGIAKELWHVPDVGHGKAFLEQPRAYDEALGRLLERVLE